MLINSTDNIVTVNYDSVSAREVVRKGGKLYLKLSTTAGQSAYNLTDFALAAPGALDGQQVELGESTLSVVFGS